jgi:hypothetical protein
MVLQLNIIVSSIWSSLFAPLLDIFLSEAFREMLDELEKGNPRRALGLYRAGGQFYLDYTKTNSLWSLDHAISFTEEALQELPKPNKNTAEYATILVAMLRDKASMTESLHDADRSVCGRDPTAWRYSGTGLCILFTF